MLIFRPFSRNSMGKYSNIKELLEGGGERLTSLRSRSRERSKVLTYVLAALPANLAETVVSAGLEAGRLTVGVAGAGWASRLRYVADTVSKRVGEAMGVEIRSVRIKVVHPPT
jgi:hypothetical protein